jgi:hypothetical protein
LLMARDDIKAIIERGRLIPATKSQITTTTLSDKQARKIAKDVVIEKPKERKMVHALRSLKGIRR